MAIRASDRAYEALHARIISLELAPGTLLPEVETAAMLGVSRTPLREALARLVSEGLVRAESGRGLSIAPIEESHVRDLFELRLVLDQQAAGIAAERGESARFRELAASLAAVPARLEQDALDRAEYYSLAQQLDSEIDRAVNNPSFVQALGMVRTQLARLRRLAQDDTPRLLAAASEHRTIAQAIADGDGALAASVTHVHLNNSLNHILSAIEQADDLLEESTAGSHLPQKRERSASGGG